MSEIGKGLVSVIIPTYYRNEYLKETLESVVKQDYDNIEILVVDDSGTEHARPIADQFGVQYISQNSNQGANSARTTGINNSQGDYIQLLDDDDRLHRKKIGRQVQALNTSDECGVVYCGYKYNHGKCVQPKPQVRGKVLECALSLDMASCVTSTMLIKRDVIEQITPLENESSQRAVFAHNSEVGMKIELARITHFDYIYDALVYRGIPDEHQEGSVESARESYQIIQEYDDIYEDFSPDLKRLALHRVYRQLGSAILHDHSWSVNAVVSYAKSCYYKSDLKSIGFLLSSFFGRSGIQVAASVWEKLQD